MANKIRTFVNEADGQTYNSATFYEYVEGETPYAWTPAENRTGMLISPIGSKNLNGGYPYTGAACMIRNSGSNTSDIVPVAPTVYPAFYKKIWESQDSDRNVYLSRFCPCSTQGTYSFDGVPDESIPAIPIITSEIVQTNGTRTVRNRGEWFDTGVMLGGLKFWLRVTFEGSLGRYGLYHNVVIDMRYSASKPNASVNESSSDSIYWGFKVQGDSSQSGTWEQIASIQQAFYNDWINRLKTSTFYFYITYSHVESVPINSYPMVGFIANHADTWYGGYISGNTKAGLERYAGPVVTTYSTEIDEYPDQPPRPAIPTTEEPDLAIVSLSAFKKALKTYDAQLPAVAKSGSYADLLNKPNTFTPPTMSASTIGGAKKGTGLDVSNSTLKVNLSTVDTGTLPIARGGTGGTSAAAARTALGAVALEDYLKMMFSDETSVEFALDNVYEDEGYKESYTIDDLSGPLCMYLAAYRNAVGAATPLSNGKWFSFNGTGHNDTASGAGGTIDFDSGGAAGSVWTYPTFGLTIKLNTYTPNSGLGSQTIPAFTVRVTEGSSLYSAFANGVKVKIPVPTVYSILTALAFKQ